MVEYVFSITAIAWLFTKTAVTIYISTGIKWENPLPHIPVSSRFTTLFVLVRKEYSIVTILITSEVIQLFISLLNVLISLLGSSGHMFYPCFYCVNFFLTAIVLKNDNFFYLLYVFQTFFSVCLVFYFWHWKIVHYISMFAFITFKFPILYIYKKNQGV